MRKITLLGLVMIASSTLFAQTPSYTWDGAQPIQVWDLVTPNWMDDNFPIPLPTTFVDNSIANFNDVTTFVGNDTIKALGVFHLIGMNVNATKNYIIRQTTAADSLVGTGTLIKDGTGELVMDIKNNMKGGTIIKNGRLRMEKQTTANIFGSSLTFQGGIANFAATSASTYPAITVPITIPAGATGTVELSRYSYWSSPISGSGDLVISVGGDRCMLGTSKTGSVAVNWNNFTGNVTLQRAKVSGVTPGYYGLLLPSTKAYDYTKISTVDSLFWNKKVKLKSGAGFAACSGIHCWGIGELQAENDSSFLTGYGAGASSSPIAYYMIGGSNTDVVFPGTITDAGGKGYNYVGVIKVGTGKYTFTSTKSVTTASYGVEVKAGTFLVDIPVTNTTTGVGRVNKSNALTVRAGAIGGGNGRITGPVQVDSLGTLVVGNNNIGQLVLGDTLTGTIKSPLTVKHGGQVIFKVASKTSFDNINTNSTAIFNGGTILVQAASNATLNDGDSIKILTTKTRTAVDSFTVKTQGFPAGTSITYAKDTITLSGYKITLIYHSSTAVANPLDNSTISVYPNPTRGEVTISSSDADITTVEILNLQGQSILRRDVRSATANIKLDNFAAGVYYTKITTAKGTKVQKLLIQ